MKHRRRKEMRRRLPNPQPRRRRDGYLICFFSLLTSAQQFPKDKECGVDDNDYLQVIPVELSDDRDDKKEVIFFLIVAFFLFFAPALTID